MELCDLDLKTYIECYGVDCKRLNEQEASRVIRHVLNGLRHLQDKCKVMHRDIKLENILVNCRPGGEVEFKIADLGQAKVNISRNLLKHTICGTPLYMAPEVYFQQPYNSTADVWSLGAMLFQMVTGNLPFYSCTHEELSSKLKEGFYHIPAGIKISAECRSFIKHCLQKNWTRRWSLDKLAQHPFVF